MSKQDFDSFLNQQLEQSRDELAPQRDLWPGIEKALAQPKKEAARPVAAWSAIAACTVAALVGIRLYTAAPQGQDPLQAMNRYFEQQKQGLLVQYQSQPALTDNWQQQLAELEVAEKAIKQALENEPENPALLKMLAQIYQQQLDLINKVHQPAWQQI